MNPKIEGKFTNCDLLINPSRYPQHAKMLKRILKRSNFSRVVTSESRQHFIDCVKDFRKSDRQYLLVWGGDGTAHDTINTLMDDISGPACGKAQREGQAIAFLRGGSGNGIQDSYEVPFRLKNQLSAYAESVENNYVERVDLLAVSPVGNEPENEKSFFEYGQLVGLGFDARVLQKRNSRVWMHGSRAGNPRSGLDNYIQAALAVFKEGFTENAFSLELIEGKYAFRGYRVNAEFPFETLERHCHVPMLEIGTRPYYGKLFKVCPDVVCNDGKIDIYLFNFTDRLSIAKNTALLWRGEHGKINKKLIKKGKPVIERYEVSGIVVRSEKPFSYHIDGELRSAAPDGSRGGKGYALRVDVCPKSMRFLVPGTFYRKFHPDFSE
jgi:diacylglycerol kinase family enzyme